ncbi:TetR/AcrR family transcriptional regulator [Streptomyces phytohabitans]|uniref:TetR/AcrR family transcriptional regulator n=1 Tax=Streptomyces phytohabitans TaxID=1150371 RepID=UPI00345B95C1
MPDRRPRADAVRNRETVLAAADALFTDSESARTVSMDDVAAAAGVGKGTLFRRFGDRDGLVRALFEARTDSLRQAVEHGPAPLGPRTAPRRRVLALLDALLTFKLANRHLSRALEETGSGSPYEATHYTWWHGTLRDTLLLLRGPASREDTGVPEAPEQPLDACAFTAHALLAAVRADLVEHLLGAEGASPEAVRAQLAAYAARVLDADGAP